MTAEALATSLGQPKSGLYYHLGELEKHGLIEVIETRQKRNFLEKTYQAVARFYRLDRDLFAATPEGAAAFEHTIHTILDATTADIERLFKTSSAPSGLVEYVAHGQRTMHLSPALYQEFHDQFEELVARYQVEHDESAVTYGLSFFVYPIEDPQNG